jgi:hypothetical protein
VEIRIIIVALFGIILAAVIGGIGEYMYGVDEGYSDGYNDGYAACPSCGIDNCEHVLVIAELFHDMAHEKDLGEGDLFWNYMRYQLIEEMENQGMGELSEKEWNCFYCNIINAVDSIPGYAVPADIKQHCEAWGEGVCYVKCGTAYIEGE